MTVVVGIAILWVLAGVACWAVLWFRTRRPLSETDRLCARIDVALRRQHGAPPSWFR